MSLKIAYQPKQALLGYIIDHGVASWIGYGGSRGGGKSGGIRRIMLNRRIKFPRTTGLIMRRVWDDVEKNHVNKMWEEFPELHDYYRVQSKVIELPEKLGGGKIFFDGAETAIDVQRKAFGPEYFDVMVDQAEQFTEAELTQLKTVCRWPGYADGSCKYILPFNPGGVGAAFLQRIFYLHEYHEREAKEDYAFIQAYGWDNIEWSRAALAADGYVGDCAGKKCGKCGPCVYYSWTDEARFKYYTTRSQYGQEQNKLPAHMRAGQLLGDFKKFEGQYFSNFDEAIHVWEKNEITFKPWWPVWISLDWGYSHSTSVHWHTQAGYMQEDGTPKKLVITFREFVTDHMSEKALAEQICAINDGLKIQTIWGGHDLWKEESNGSTKEAAMSDVFARNGLPRMRKARIDRVDGWRCMHRALDEGEWIITRNCKEAIRALPTLVYDKKKDNEDVLKTATMYDDVADDLRYGIYSQADQKAESIDEVFARKTSHLKDITSRNIMMMKLQAERTREIKSFGRVPTRSLGRHLRYGT
jgi:Phage terminase large subunit